MYAVGMTKRWKEENPAVSTRIPAQAREELLALLRQRGLTFKQFLLQALAEWRAQGLPESQGGVKITIGGKTRLLSSDEDFGVIEAAINACDLEAERLQRLAKRTLVQETRMRILKQAQLYLDAQWLLGEILEAKRLRQHVLDTGIKAPRHRQRALQPTVRPDVVMPSRAAKTGP